MRNSILFILAIFSIIFLATSVSSYNENFLASKGIPELNKDIFFKTFGEFTDYLSYMSFLKADIYYHGGIYDFHGPEEDSHEHLHIVEEAEHSHEDQDAHECKHAHEDNNIQEHGHLPYEGKPSLNILLSIGEAVNITEHRHLLGKEEKEVLPWIYYAVKLNPHNEIAYSVGGFWIAVKLKNPDEAIKFLKEGYMNNPDSYEICQALGQIYFLKKSDYRNAMVYLEKAKNLSDEQNADKFEKRNIYSLLAEAYYRTGNKERAIDLYKDLLVDFPRNESIEKRIKEILLTPSAS